MYSIQQLSLISGLTTRTLRNHLAAGLLHGEKVNGVWTFSEEQVSAFFADPAVRPSIRAKRSAILYDFQTGFDNTPDEACILLDLSLDPHQARQAADFFCVAANRSEHIRFSFSYEKQKAHFILKGAEAEVREIMRQYYRR